MKEHLITQIEKYKSELRSIDPNTESARAEFDDLKNKLVENIAVFRPKII